MRTVDQPFLKQVYRLSDNAVIFDSNKNESVPGFGRRLEGHLYIDGVAFILTQDITDYSDPHFAKERAFFLRDEAKRPAWMANNKPQKLAELQDLMSRPSGRKDVQRGRTGGNMGSSYSFFPFKRQCILSKISFQMERFLSIVSEMQKLAVIKNRESWLFNE